MLHMHEICKMMLLLCFLLTVCVVQAGSPPPNSANTNKITPKSVSNLNFPVGSCTLFEQNSGDVVIETGTGWLAWYSDCPANTSVISGFCYPTFNDNNLRYRLALQTSAGVNLGSNDEYRCEWAILDGPPTTIQLRTDAVCCQGPNPDYDNQVTSENGQYFAQMSDNGCFAIYFSDGTPTGNYIPGSC